MKDFLTTGKKEIEVPLGEPYQA